MAYSDYGAFVYCNGERRRDKEDVAVYEDPMETFGDALENVPSGARIFQFLLKAKTDGKERPGWAETIHHGIMGDGPVRVACHKQGLPRIFDIDDEGNIIDVVYTRDKHPYEYEPFGFEYNGYKFSFAAGRPYEAWMTEPDGTEWHCEYDYEYGAGFED